MKEADYELEPITDQTKLDVQLAKVNEAFHRKRMEYFQEEIKILEGKQ